MERLVIHGGATHDKSIGQRCDTLDLLVNGELKRVMVDCGMEFVREGEVGGPGPGADLSLLNDGKKIDALVLTHSHIDHIGWIAALYKLGYLAEDAPIISSPQTAAVMPYALEDGLKHNSAYTAFDAAAVLKRSVVIPEPGEFEVLPGLMGYFPQAGHIPGAMSVILRKGLITGDISWHDAPTNKGALLPSKSWPRERIPNEIWGTDLTYGAGAKKPLKEEVERLIAQTKFELNEGSTVIIPAFANGRGQNVLNWLDKAGIPAWADGAIRQIYRVFQENRWSDRDGKLPKIGGKTLIRFIQSEEEREELIEDSTPKVIVTTGGIGDFGPIIRYMEAGLPNSKWRFYFTSWLAPGTNGAKLMEKAKRSGEQQLKITTKYEEKKVIPIRASFDRFSLSAHGDLDEFVAFVEDIVSCRGGEPLKRVVLTHGTQDSKATAAKRLAKLAKTIIYGERNTIISLAD